MLLVFHIHYAEFYQRTEANSQSDRCVSGKMLSQGILSVEGPVQRLCSTFPLTHGRWETHGRELQVINPPTGNDLVLIKWGSPHSVNCHFILASVESHSDRSQSTVGMTDGD